MISDSLPEIKPDEISRMGLERPKIGTVGSLGSPVNQDSINQVLQSLLDNQPYSVDTLILYGVNPLFESIHQKQFAEAFQKAPFIVNCTSFLDETTAYSDLVLPDHVFLEKWEVSRNVPAVEFLHFGVQQPVINQLYDTRHFGDVLIQVGQNIGSSVGNAFPWKNYENYLKAHARAIFDSGEGTIVSESVDTSWIEYLKKRGWQVFEYSTFEEFWDLLLENGGWFDPSYPKPQKKRIFKTPSGKFEFYSQTLKIKINKQVLATNPFEEQIDTIYGNWKMEARGDLIFLPHFETPRFTKDDPDFTYYFLAFQPLTNLNGVGANLALLQELSGLYSREYWNTWAEINNETATELGIKEGDYVNIISLRGRLSVKVKILPTVMPEVIIMPSGRFSKTTDLNPYAIFIEDIDLITGVPSLISTKVRIEKAKSIKVI
jgi:anaerobic selenocysteine-containing dehydrogenase